MSKKGFISKLTEEIKKLPFGAKYDTPEDAIEALRRAGVKDAELEYSGLEELLRPGYVPGLGLSKHSLEAADAARADQFDFKDRRAFEFPNHEMPTNLDELADAAQSEYKGYSLPGGKNYREFIYQFSNAPEQRNPNDITKTRSYSHHFQDIPNYLGHVRATDEIWDGEPVLNVNEVQSDVLGHALKRGTPGENIRVDMTRDEMDRLEEIAKQFPDNPLAYPDLFDSAMGEYADEVNDLIKPHTNLTIDDVPPEDVQHFLEEGEIQARSGYFNTAAGPGPDRFPNTKNYRERMLERSVDVAQSEGKSKLVVPLEDLPKVHGPDDFTNIPDAEGFIEASDWLPMEGTWDDYEKWYYDHKDKLDSWVGEDTGSYPKEWHDRLSRAIWDWDTDVMDEILPRQTGNILAQNVEGKLPPIQQYLHRGEHIQKQEYDPKKGRVPKALKKIARDQDMEYKTVEKDGILYGLLDFKGKKKKPTELYSVGGLLGAGALQQIMQDPSQDVR